MYEGAQESGVGAKRKRRVYEAGEKSRARSPLTAKPAQNTPTPRFAPYT